MTFNDKLQWRYATKKFDATKKLTDAQLTNLLESLRLTASSYGLQPYKFVVVTDPALRAKMREASWNQTQVTDASHVIVLCAMTKVDEAFVDHYVESIVKIRGVTAESLAGYRGMMTGFVKSKTQDEITEWARRQTYISLGFLLSSAADMQIDACPMEGFDPVKIDEILGLKKDGLTSVLLCPVGFRAADDATASYTKVRFDTEELVLRK